MKEVVKPGLYTLILFIQHNPFTLHNKVQTQQRLKCYKLQNSKQQNYSTDCTIKAKKGNVHVANVTRKTTVKSCGRGRVCDDREMKGRGGVRVSTRGHRSISGN